MCNHGNDDTDDRNTADDNSNNNNDDQSVELLKKMSKQTLINVVKALEQVVLRVSRDNIVSVGHLLPCLFYAHDDDDDDCNAHVM